MQPDDGKPRRKAGVKLSLEEVGNLDPRAWQKHGESVKEAQRAYLLDSLDHAKVNVMFVEHIAEYYTHTTLVASLFLRTSASLSQHTLDEISHH